MRIVSLFSGAGGLDLGFSQAGFDVIWANEFDRSIHETYRANHKAYLNTEDIRTIMGEDIPDCEGIIGGPPCQSWSHGGKSLGIADDRGKLFYEFIRIVGEKKPLFFVAENVPGIQAAKHLSAYNDILKEFRKAGYRVKVNVLDATNFGVAQNRKRVFFIGFLRELNVLYEYPKRKSKKLTLKDVIWDIKDDVIPAKNGIYTNGEHCTIANHEYIDKPFPDDYATYNKSKNWDEQAFTVRANGKYMGLHPQAPNMIKDSSSRWIIPDNKKLFRRLSVRECARIQGFPDTFIFKYSNLEDGYKMVGNAVPVKVAYEIAMSLKSSKN